MTSASTATNGPAPGVTVTGFLGAFFANPLESVNLRALLPRGVKTCGGGKMCVGHKLQASRRELGDDQDLRVRLAAVNKEHGVYFVVNAGGDKDADITMYNAFFAEIDDKPIEEQNALLDACTIPPSSATRRARAQQFPVRL